MFVFLVFLIIGYFFYFFLSDLSFNVLFDFYNDFKFDITKVVYAKSEKVDNLAQIMLVLLAAYWERAVVD